MPNIAHIQRAWFKHPDRLYIISAAVKVGRLIISMPAPNRHSDLIKNLDGITDLVTPDQLGFLDSEGNFRERKQAKHIARDAQQLLPTASKSGDLFSEDLW